MPIPIYYWDNVKGKDLIEVLDYIVDNSVPPPQDIPVASTEQLGVVSIAEDIEIGEERVATSNLVALAIGNIVNTKVIGVRLSRNTNTSGALFSIQYPFGTGSVTYSQSASNKFRLTFNGKFEEVPFVGCSTNGFVLEGSMCFFSISAITNSYVDVIFRKHDGEPIDLVDIENATVFHIYAIGT